MIETIKKEGTTFSIIAFGTAVLVSIVWFFSDIRFSNDDQFILYRYIDNLIAGNGFVYNLGERVLGSTTPLFTMLVAVLAFVFTSMETPSVVALTNIVCFALSAPFFYYVARRFLSTPFAITALLMYALLLSRTVLEGMETPLFLLILFGALTALYTGRHYLVSILIALLVLTRPDAVLIAMLVGVHWVITLGMAQAVWLSLISVLVFLPWAIFATWYFGSFIPQSLVTKLQSADIYVLPWYQALKIQIAHVSKLLFGKLFDFQSMVLQVVVNLVPITALVAVGTSRLFSTSGGWLVVAIPGIYLMSFSISNPIIFPWYLSQTEPFWILLIVMGAERIALWCKNKWVPWMVIVLLLIGPVAFLIDNAFLNNSKPKATLFSVATFLSSVIKEGESVGIADIGIVGYVTHAYIHDFIGLVSPDSVAFYRENECMPRNAFYTIPPHLIEHTSPTYVVGRKDQISPCFYAESAHKEYQLVFVDETGMVEVWHKAH